MSEALPAYPADVEKGRAVATGGNVIVVAQSPSQGCECTAGWVLFGVGWVVPLCWLIGIFLPLCTKNKNDKRAAIGSGVMIVVYGVVIGVVVGLVIVPMTQAAVSISKDFTSLALQQQNLATQYQSSMLP
jgi:hypothetical protein